MGSGQLHFDDGEAGLVVVSKGRVEHTGELVQLVRSVLDAFLGEGVQVGDGLELLRLPICLHSSCDVRLRSVGEGVFDGLQGCDDLGGVGRPFLAIFGEEPFEQHNQQRWKFQLGVEGRRGGRRLLDVLHDESDRAFSHERRPSDDEFVEDDTQRIEVAAWIDELATSLLRREVQRGAGDEARPREGFLHGVVAHETRDAEVEHLDEVLRATLVGQKNIVGFQIAVDYTVCVGLDEGLRHLSDDVAGHRQRERAVASETCAQCFSLQVFHREIQPTIAKSPVFLRPYDVGVPEARAGGHFPFEAVDLFFFMREPGVEDLERHLPVIVVEHRSTEHVAGAAAPEHHFDTESIVEDLPDFLSGSADIASTCHGDGRSVISDPSVRSRVLGSERADRPNSDEQPFRTPPNIPCPGRGVGRCRSPPFRRPESVFYGPEGTPMADGFLVGSLHVSDEDMFADLAAKGEGGREAVATRRRRLVSVDHEDEFGLASADLAEGDLFSTSAVEGVPESALPILVHGQCPRELLVLRVVDIAAQVPASVESGGAGREKDDQGSKGNNANHGWLSVHVLECFWSVCGTTSPVLSPIGAADARLASMSQASEKVLPDLFVLSDLHVGSGVSAKTGLTSRLETFFYDREFSEFVDRVITHAACRKRPCVLVLNGDIIDFLGITATPDEAEQKRLGFNVSRHEERHGMESTPAKDAWKLRHAFKGHPKFFSAIVRLIRAGNRVHVNRGNHDLDMHWPEVREAFFEELLAIAEREYPEVTEEVLRERFEIRPWFYYEPGRVWIEHGHQYEASNSLRYQLNPVIMRRRKGKTEPLLDLPTGSLFVRYIVNRLKLVDPYSTQVSSLEQYLDVISSFNVMDLGRALVVQFPFFIRALKRARVFEVSSMDKGAPLHEARVKELGRKTGLGDRLAAVDAMRQAPMGVTKYTLATEMMRPIVRSILTFLSIAVVAIGVWMFLFSAIFNTSWLADSVLGKASLMAVLAVVTIVGLFLAGTHFARRYRMSGDTSHDKLRDVAGRMAESLEVPVVVMGHSHGVDRRENEKGAVYANSGTWTVVRGPWDMLQPRARQFTFVYVHDEKEVELLRWDPPSHCWEPVTLLEDWEPSRLERLMVEASGKDDRLVR